MGDKGMKQVTLPLDESKHPYDPNTETNGVVAERLSNDAFAKMLRKRDSSKEYLNIHCPECDVVFRVTTVDDSVPDFCVCCGEEFDDIDERNV